MKRTPIQRKACSIKPRTPKPKTCTQCGTQFQQARMGQKVCFAMACMLASARLPENQAKARKAIDQLERQELKVRREKLKDRREYMREAQTAFNAWVRARDAGQPCISCGSTPNDLDLFTGSRWDAGHYRSVGACPELRFEPLNVHRQCVKCNRNLSGNAVEYRIRLVLRIGADRVAWLEGPHQPLKHTIEDLKAITAHYRALARGLKGAA